MRIAVLADYFSPGHLAGGPVLSLVRILAMDAGNEHLVLTRDRDKGQRRPYESVTPLVLVERPHAEVGYLPPRPKSIFWAVASIREFRPDVLYLNSLWSLWFGLLPLLLNKMGIVRAPVVLLAPRGECSPGALALKSWKKDAVAPFARWLTRDCLWHVSSERERHEVLRWIRNVDVRRPPRFVIAPDPPVEPVGPFRDHVGSNKTVVVFASRIHPKKGLLRAIHLLESVQVPIEFRIHGVVEDAEYWKRCQAAMSSLPEAVSTGYFGAYEPAAAIEIFRNADLLLLPTEGENFGHVFAEAFAVGCPALTTDTTPWTDFVIDTGGKVANTDDELREALEALLALDGTEREKLRNAVFVGFKRWYLKHGDAGNPFSHGSLATVRSGPPNL